MVLENVSDVAKKLNESMNELILTFTFIRDSDKVVLNRRRFNIEFYASTLDREELSRRTFLDETFERFKELHSHLQRKMKKEENPVKRELDIR